MSSEKDKLFYISFILLHILLFPFITIIIHLNVYQIDNINKLYKFYLNLNLWIFYTDYNIKNIFFSVVITSYDPKKF